MAGNQINNVMMVDLTTGLPKTPETGGTPDVIQLGVDVELITGANMVIAGNLTVNGTTTTVNSSQVNITDNYLYLNADYTAEAARPGGLVINVDPIATTADTVAATGFVAGTAAVQATGTITVTAANATVADTVTIAGNALAAVTGARTPGSDDFSIDSGTDAGIKLEIIAALNDAANSFDGDVVATDGGGGVVDLTAVAVGAAGNAVTMAASDGTFTAVSGANLASGANGVNPNVTTTGSATFSVGQIIQVSGADDQQNDGIYEVLTHVGTLLEIRGIGATATVEDFTQNQFVTDTTVAGAITHVNVAVLQSNGSGTFETSFGNSTPFTFTSVGVGNVTLQDAYEAGNTITTSAGEGDITFTGDQDFIVTTSDFDVDTNGGAITLDADAASNFTVAGASLTLSTTGSGDVLVDSVAEIDLLAGTTVDINAGTTITLDTADAADASGNDITLTAGSSGAGTAGGASIILTPGDGDTTGAAGDVTISSPADEDESLLTLTSLGTNGNSVSMFTGTSNPDTTVTADAGSLFLRDTGTGSIAYLNTSTGSGTAWTAMATGGTVTLQVAYENGNTITTSSTEGNVTIGGTEDLVITTSDLLVDTTASISLDADAASNFTVAGGNLTLNTTSSGFVDVTAAAQLNLTGGTFVDINAATTMTLDTANAVDASGNDITVTAGTSTGGTNNGASIILTPGDGDTTGVAGDVTISSPADEDESLLTLASLGTNGNSMSFYTGTSSPDGAITADAGSLFSRDTGAGATLFLNTSTTSGTTWSRILTAGGVTLQDAYEAGNTITTDSTEGDVTITGTEDLIVTTSDLLVDTTASISLDADASSNFTVAASTAGALDLTLSSTNAGAGTGNVLVSSDDEIDLNAGGLLDINAGANMDVDVTGTYDMLASGTFSIAGTGASNVTADSGDLVLSTTTSGELDLTSADLMDVNAGANLDIDVTGTFDMLSTGVFSIAGTGASTVATTSGDLTLSTTTSGDIFVTAAGEVEMTADCIGVHPNSGNEDTSSFHSEMGRFQLWGTSATTGNGSYVGHNTQRVSTTAKEAGTWVVLSTSATVTDSIVATTAATGALDANVEVASSALFSVGDLVTITGSAVHCNDDLYEVASIPDGTNIRLRGPNGATARVTTFTGLDLAPGGAGGTIQKATVSVIQTGTDGLWEGGTGDDDTIAFLNFQGATTLQEAYENGNTITTDSTEGDVTIGGTEDLIITVSDLNVDTTATITLNADAASNFTVDTTGAAQDLILSVAGATDSSLVLSSSGTGGDALQITATAGGIDVNVVASDANALEVSDGTNEYINVNSTDVTLDLNQFTDIVGSGIGIRIVTDDALVAGDLVTIATSGNVELADADTGTSEDAFVMGVSTGTFAGTNTARIFTVPGSLVPMRFAAAPAAANNGDTVFLDTTSGQATLTPPGSGIRVIYQVGYLQGGNGATTTPTVLFMPRLVATVP